MHEIAVYKINSRDCVICRQAAFSRGGGGGGDSHMKEAGMLIGNVEFLKTPKGDQNRRGPTKRPF